MAPRGGCGEVLRADGRRVTETPLAPRVCLSRRSPSPCPAPFLPSLSATRISATMQLQHLSTFMAPEDRLNKVTAVCFSPNNRRLAVVTIDRVVHLFDEHGEKKDKFATKPANKVRCAPCEGSCEGAADRKGGGLRRRPMHLLECVRAYCGMDSRVHPTWCRPWLFPPTHRS